MKTFNVPEQSNTQIIKNILVFNVRQLSILFFTQNIVVTQYHRHFHHSNVISL